MIIENGKNNYALQYGNETIPFIIEFKERRQLSISVYPEGHVEVLAPEGKSLDEVLRRVKKRASWIAKQRAYFETFQPLPVPKRFISGETHHYLGRQYRLKVHESSTEAVKLKGRFLQVHLPNGKNTSRIETLMDHWYRGHAQSVFRSRLEWCLDNAPSLKLDSPTFSLRKMPKRWGSCTHQGAILLNPDLVKTPRYCIEYVLMHELCHLRIHQHSPAYYALLTQCLPDWKTRQARLNAFVI